DLSSTLRRVRAVLSSVQAKEKDRLTRAARWLAVLFVAAIFALEIHIEFHYQPAIFAYVLLFTSILVIHAYARWRRYQQHSEDYRALSEALRVQLAWWDAGLTGPENRVDRIYLGATGGSLGRVRTALRHLIDAVSLMVGSTNLFEPPR